MAIIIYSSHNKCNQVWAFSFVPLGNVAVPIFCLLKRLFLALCSNIDAMHSDVYLMLHCFYLLSQHNSSILTTALPNN